MWTLAVACALRWPHLTSDEAWTTVDRVVDKKLGGWDEWDIHGWVPDNSDSRGNLESFAMDDIQVDFIKCFEVAEGIPENAWHEAIERAENYPIQWEAKRRSKDYLKFLSFCAYLSIIVKTDIGLSQRKVGELLHKQPMTVGGWIKWAVKQGLLTKTAEHTFHPKSPAQSKAAEFAVTPKLQNLALKAMDEADQRIDRYT